MKMNDAILAGSEPLAIAELQTSLAHATGRTMPVLVVSGDQAFAASACTVLGLSGVSAHAAKTLADAADFLRAMPAGLAICDADTLSEPGLVAALRALTAAQPGLPVLAVTSRTAIAEVVIAIRAGACDFLPRAEALAQLPACARRLALTGLASTDHEDDPSVVAHDPGSRALLTLARRVAASDATVLLGGESGTGKEVLARFIHRNSIRASQNFVAVNCAAIPDNLVEATLFGYERGAYTGAIQSQPGRFELAQGGTLLLDEIGDLPLPVQAKLLRVLQERELERVGGTRTVKLDVRVIAATNRPLREAVECGAFREDLYYRLAVFPLTVPALRDRRRDIVPLAQHCLARHSPVPHTPLQLSARSGALLESHYWPGNVRELDNVMQRAAILATGVTVEPEHLLFEPPLRASPSEPVFHVADAVGAATARSAAESASRGIRSVERDHIIATLAAVQGSRKQAVARLGISERTLRNRLREYRQSDPVRFGC